MIEIYSVGGYLEVGRNLTAIKYKDEVILLDMGIHLENYITYTEDEADIKKLSYRELQNVGAVPNINYIKDLIKNVKAIIPSHAHLDHIGAIPFMAKKFDCPILLTPYSKAVLDEILKDNGMSIPNKMKVLSDNSTYQISNNITIEFINVTHSVPDTVMIAVHTPEGIVLYTGDYKFDDNPTLGKVTNYQRLKELKNVKVLIMDTLYSERPGRTKSESDAQKMLIDLCENNVDKKSGLIITTFSSQIARLKAIIKVGKKMHRKIIFLGRSLSKYVYAAENVGIARFSDDVEIVKFSSKVKKRLNRIQKEGKEKYLIVCTGHQAEKKAVLSKMVNKEFYHFSRNDTVIFSCITIPQEPNIKNRHILEEKIKSFGTKVFIDVHASGHASQEDQKMLIDMIHPEIIIPDHSDSKKVEAFKKNITIWYPNIKLKILKEGELLQI